MKTQFTMAYRCAECGKIEFHHISIFQLSGKKSLDVHCSCGHKGLRIHTKDYKNYRITIFCVVCNIPHIYQVSLKEMLKGEPIVLSCTDYELELCFLGEEKLVEEAVDKYEQDLEQFIDELGYDDFFVNSEIMMECLNILHDLAENNELKCECGGENIDVNLLEDKIEIKCEHCKSIYMLPAKNRRDVERLKQRKNIFIEKNNFSLWETFHMDPK